MFWFIKQFFITVLRSSGSVATKCVIRPTLIDLNPVELNYY